MDKIKKYGWFLVKCIVVYFVADGLGTGIRALTSMLEGQHGAPSFVTPEFAVYGFVIEILLVAAFLLIGNAIPIKGRITKGIIFALLYWGSAYLPQVLGMLGGHSSIITKEAFTVGTICADSLGYIVKGVALGIIFGKREAVKQKECSKKTYITAVLVSMILFPAVLIALEWIGGHISNQMYCINAFSIDSEDKISFYLVFYLFQAVSGLLFPIVYRLTEYNQKQSWMKFASVYAWMLWLPIVLIMMFFGVGARVTIIWGLLMITAIYLDVFLFTRIMNGHRS